MIELVIETNLCLFSGEVTRPMCTAAEAAAPASTGQALAMVRAGLGYLAGCDAGSLATSAQAEALIGLEHAEAQHTAARAKILSVFTAQQGYEADGYYGASSWLRAITRVTKGGAAAVTGWARRLAAHPVNAAALAAGQIPASLARLICDWTDKLPEQYRDDADGILLAAVVGGADQHDLARLGREMLERGQTSPDTDNDQFDERALWLDTTFGGAGRLQGDLTPACAAALTVVLDALGQKAGPEDTRTLAQRRHDAIEEACRRLIGGHMIPGRDGQPPHLTVHIDLNDLRGASGLERAWTPAMAAAGPGSGYLTGPAAEAAACDAVLTTIVTGQIDWQVLDQLTSLWLTTHGHADGRQEDYPDGPRENQADGPRENQADGPRENHDANQPATRPGHVPDYGHVPFPGTGHPAGPGDTPAAADEHDCAISGCLAATRQRLQATLLRWSLDLLSGPGGLAGQLRGTLLGAPFNTLSQPLDIGRTTRTIPAHLRTAVIQRDQHCQFPGCTQPPAVCEIHHLIPWAKGGPTSLGNLRLLCRFHHLVVVHQWGWTISCHPDGTTTATAPDGRTLYSHGPPTQAA
jgi:Domain of unknown function (DUF222)/HNH endonuclease